MIEHFGVSEPGPVRENNEDYIACCAPEEAEAQREKGYLFVIADGVGGDLAGEVASREAANRLIDSYSGSSRRWGKALQEAFQQANLHVFDLGQSRPEYRRMQTTLSAIALLDNQAVIGHVGDTRIYQIRGQDIQQLTRDHSEVGELMRMQIITPDEARTHPRRHIITRTIGGEPFLQPEFRSIEVEIGDVFVLCTDGLWEPIAEQEILAAVANTSPGDACRRLIHLAVERETADNLSIQIARVTGWDKDPAPAESRRANLIQKTLGLFGRKQRRE